MTTPEQPRLGPTGEPYPPDPQAALVRDGDGEQPGQDVTLEEAESDAIDQPDDNDTGEGGGH